jgi:hypothetical protein
LRDLQRQSDEAVTDTERKILEQDMKAYDVLVGEFEPSGERMQHIITSGTTNVGVSTEKQEWSKYLYLCIDLQIILINY